MRLLYFCRNRNEIQWFPHNQDSQIWNAGRVYNFAGSWCGGPELSLKVRQTQLLPGSGRGRATYTSVPLLCDSGFQTGYTQESPGGFKNPHCMGDTPTEQIKNFWREDWCWHFRSQGAIMWSQVETMSVAKH